MTLNTTPSGLSDELVTLFARTHAALEWFPEKWYGVQDSYSNDVSIRAFEPDGTVRRGDYVEIASTGQVAYDMGDEPNCGTVLPEFLEEASPATVMALFEAYDALRKRVLVLEANGGSLECGTF